MVSGIQFWWKWLFGVGLLLVVFGLILAFFNQSSVMNSLVNDRINPTFWRNYEELPEGYIRFQSWIYGVLGATLSGWGVFVMFIARYPFKAKEKWAWNCLFAGLLLWFLVDTVISVNFLVILNVIVNIILFLLMLVPLIASRKHFTT